MDKLAAIAGFADAKSARRGLNKVFEIIIPKDTDVSADGEGEGKKKAGGRKRKTGMIFSL
jgi:hypothetical protein